MLGTAKAVQTDCLCGAHTAVVRRALNTLLSADAPAVSCAFDRSQWRLPLFRDIFLQFYCNVLGCKDRLFLCSLCPFPDQPSDMPSHWQRRQVSFCFDSWRRKGFREQKTCLAINNAPDTGRASPLSYFRGGSGVESACNAGVPGDTGSIPGSGRSPGGGNGNPLQCSCRGNPMDRGARRATVHAGAESLARLKRFSTHARTASENIYLQMKKRNFLQ